EQRVLLVRLHRDVDLDAVELGGLRARLAQALVRVGLALPLQLLVEVRGLLAGRDREPARQQVVPGVARLHVDQRALGSQSLQVFEQDDVHRVLLFLVRGGLQPAEIQPDVAQADGRGGEHEYRHRDRENEEHREHNEGRWYAARKQQRFYDRDPLNTKPEQRVEQQRPGRRRPR